MTTLSNRLLAALQLDFHVFVTLLFRSWSIVAGGVTILLIPLCLTGVQQGYYYTFASMLALQIFFELGMSQVVVQIVAHEAAHLQADAQGRYTGAVEARARLAAMGRLLRRWYLVAALLFLLAAGAAGLAFFRKGDLPWIQWAGPWLALVATTAGNLMVSWRMAFVEGLSLVGQVGRLRLAQSMVGYLLMWVTLAGGGGLWAVAMVPSAAFVASSLWLRRSPAHPVYAPPAGASLPPGEFSWRREILPFQWRIAVSWISGFFIFQLFTPLVFKHQGAVEAGRLGLGITIFNAVVTVGCSWVSAKVPVFGRLIAQGQRAEAIRIFKRQQVVSGAFIVAMAAAFVLGVWVVQLLGLRLAGRLPEVPVLACLALVAIANSFVLPAAFFMRAHKEEPMLLPSVVMAVLTGLGAWLAAPGGALWIVGVYAFFVCFVSVPWTAWLLRGYFRRT